MSPENAAPNSLAGQVAIVTGGASGIGRATCLALAGLGVRVVVADRSAEKSQCVADELAGITTTPALGLACDVTSESDLDALVKTTVAKFGQIDVLVHSAGLLRAPGSAPLPLAQLSVDEFDLIVNTNLKGTFLTNRAVLPTMFAQKAGQIINVASTSGRKARPLDSAYCASKFGVVGLTESLAEEVRSFGIRVQLVLPDAVATPLWDQNGPVPMPDWALPPERIAEAIVWLLCLPPDATVGEIAVHPLRARRRASRSAANRIAEPKDA
jgi:NAD(P)-dependent dehydrogenase (short-subunit alcohol dehydrogenase family)